jgi:hypothetical protein
MDLLQPHIDQWNELAARVDSKAEIESKRGDNASAAVWRRKAAVYRRTAESLILEVRSGEPHCVDHLEPMKTCYECRRKRGERGERV